MQVKGWSRIWWIGKLDGNHVRLAPNPGFKLGRFKWSRKHGRRRR